MGAQLWLFRDSNWSPDYPTSAQVAAGLYVTGQGEPVSGVLAADQTALSYLLAAIGPLPLADGTLLTSATLQETLYTHWTPEPGNLSPQAHDNPADFDRQLGEALLARLLTDPGELDWVGITQAVLRAAREKHLLIYTANSALAELTAEQGWDGALRPAAQDYLLVVDSNVGFNKVNARARRSIRYEVDLTDLAQPVATLSVNYDLSELAAHPVGCQQIDDQYGLGGYASLTTGCYWNYLRVYAPAGAALQASVSTPTPANWLWNGQIDSGAAVSHTGEAGLMVWEQLLVVPAGAVRQATFQYDLPPTVVHYEFDSQTYCAQLIKQPGTQADPVYLRLTLPDRSQVLETTPPAPAISGQLIVFEQIALLTDQQICVEFAVSQ
jgi:hypothetical protein